MAELPPEGVPPVALSSPIRCFQWQLLEWAEKWVTFDATSIRICASAEAPDAAPVLMIMPPGLEVRPDQTNPLRVVLGDTSSEVHLKFVSVELRAQVVAMARKLAIAAAPSLAPDSSLDPGRYPISMGAKYMIGAIQPGQVGASRQVSTPRLAPGSV
jgi:hypothetical protein